MEVSPARVSVAPSTFSSVLADAASFAPPPCPPSPALAVVSLALPPLFAPSSLPPWFDKPLREAARAAAPCCRVCCSCALRAPPPLSPVFGPSPFSGASCPPASPASLASSVSDSLSWRVQGAPRGSLDTASLEGEEEEEEEQAEEEETHEEAARCELVERRDLRCFRDCERDQERENVLNSPCEESRCRAASVSGSGEGPRDALSRSEEACGRKTRKRKQAHQFGLHPRRPECLPAGPGSPSACVSLAKGEGQASERGGSPRTQTERLVPVSSFPREQRDEEREDGSEGAKREGEEARDSAGVEDVKGVKGACEAPFCEHQRTQVDKQINDLKRLIWEFAFDPRDWASLRQVDRAGRAFAETAFSASLQLLRLWPSPTVSPGLSRSFSRLGHLLPDMLLDCAMSDFLHSAFPPPPSPSPLCSREPQKLFGDSGWACRETREATAPGGQRAQPPCLQNVPPLESGCGEWSVWLYDRTGEPPLRRLPPGAAAALGARSAGGLAKALAGAAETLEAGGEWIDYAEGTVLMWGRKAAKRAPKTPRQLRSQDAARPEEGGKLHRNGTRSETEPVSAPLQVLDASSPSRLTRFESPSLSHSVYVESQTFFLARYRRLLADALYKQTLLAADRKTARRSRPGRFFEAAIAEALAALPGASSFPASCPSLDWPAPSLASAATNATTNLHAFQVRQSPAFLSDETETFLFDVVWARPRGGGRGTWGVCGPPALWPLEPPLEAKASHYPSRERDTVGSRCLGRQGNSPHEHGGRRGLPAPVSETCRPEKPPYLPSSSSLPSPGGAPASLSLRCRPEFPPAAPRVGGGVIVIYRHFADWAAALCHSRLWQFLFLALSRGLDAAHAFLRLYDAAGLSPAWDGYVSAFPVPGRWHPSTPRFFSSRAPFSSPPLSRLFDSGSVPSFAPACFAPDPSGLLPPSLAARSPPASAVSPFSWGLPAERSVGSCGDRALVPVWRGRPLLQLRDDGAAPRTVRGVLFEQIMEEGFMCHLRRRGYSRQGLWVPAGASLLSSLPQASSLFNDPGNPRLPAPAFPRNAVRPTATDEGESERDSEVCEQDERRHAADRLFQGRHTGDSRRREGTCQVHEGGGYGTEESRSGYDRFAPFLSGDGPQWVRLPPFHLSLSPRAPAAALCLFSAFQNALQAGDFTDTGEDEGHGVRPRLSARSAGPVSLRPSLLPDLEKAAEGAARELSVDARAAERFACSGLSPGRFQSPLVADQQECSWALRGAAPSPPLGYRVSFLLSPSEPAPWRNVGGRSRPTLPRDDPDCPLPVSPSVSLSADGEAQVSRPVSDEPAGGAPYPVGTSGAPPAKRSQTPPSPHAGARSALGDPVPYPTRARQSSGGFSAQFRLAPRRRGERRGPRVPPRERRSSAGPRFHAFFSPSPEAGPQLSRGLAHLASGDEETGAAGVQAETEAWGVGAPRRRRTSSGWSVGPSEEETAGPEGRRAARRLRPTGFQFFGTPSELHPAHARLAPPGVFRVTTTRPNQGEARFSLCTPHDASAEGGHQPAGEIAQEGGEAEGGKERDVGCEGEFAFSAEKAATCEEATGRSAAVPVSLAAVKDVCLTATTTASSLFSLAGFSSSPPASSSSASRSAASLSGYPSCLSPALVAAEERWRGRGDGLSPVGGRAEVDEETPAEGGRPGDGRGIRQKSHAASPFESLSPCAEREGKEDGGEQGKQRRERRNSGLSPLLRRLSLQALQASSGEGPTGRPEDGDHQALEIGDAKREEGQGARGAFFHWGKSSPRSSCGSVALSEGDAGDVTAEGTNSVAFLLSRPSLEPSAAFGPFSGSSLPCSPSLTPRRPPATSSLSDETRSAAAGDFPRSAPHPGGDSSSARSRDEDASPLSSLSPQSRPTPHPAVAHRVSHLSPVSPSRSLFRAPRHEASLSPCYACSRDSRKPASALGSASSGAGVSRSAVDSSRVSAQLPSRERGRARVASSMLRKRKAETPEGAVRGKDKGDGGCQRLETQEEKGERNRLQMPSARARDGPTPVHRRGVLERKRQKMEKSDSAKKQMKETEALEAGADAPSRGTSVTRSSPR
ncbi:conserved hypothetical protein [Neospora caninum Liverpool]|uniref:Uncharacterized protein n=1 Tax=Neospora caninum (strain Liverpool) TaxID=572307 RepID=F0VJV2_NEOCL|nr:conserved hypothetical protein [Neospora caninum Liverpool]CBZ54013.1 conserved hypothetical protein [Neospora caninum Liverpool]|eukprot:XP_003884045.1 conserved hypothetical protein [Neospora caninum Liverpool]